MRVTNEQAASLIFCSDYNFCEECPKYGEVCPIGLHGCVTQIAIAADLLEARKLIKEMREVIQDSKRFHVNTLENGRDRIVSLGGLCDSVEDMERGDRLVRNANAILERTKEYQ